MRSFCPSVAFVCAVVAIVASGILPDAQAQAQCASVGVNQTCTNPAGTTVSGAASAIFDGGSLTLTNFGTVAGNPGDGVDATGNSTITNFGTISGSTTAINVFAANLTLTNYGTITGAGAAGVNANSLSLVNYGIISGPTAVTAAAASTLTNAGTIMGTGANPLAIDFGFSAGDTLNFLPGSRIIGFISLGAGDTVNVRTGRDIAWMLSFGCGGCGGLVNTGSSANVSGGAPFVINGDQVATLDPTGFGLTDRRLMDFAGNISYVLGSRFSQISSAGSAPARATAFASDNASPAHAALANEPALAKTYAAADSGLPSATTFDRKSGISIWSKGFIGNRTQDANGLMLASTSTAYGGMAGIDKSVSPYLSLGAYLGAGTDKTGVEFNSQSLRTDYAFVGVYGHYEWSMQFADVAVTGGHTNTSSSRQVANNLAPNGLETAIASYNGWFGSPELAYGYRVPLLANFTMTPIARLRYVVGYFDGYTETGSAQNMSIASRSTQNIEERIELQLSHSVGSPERTVQTIVTVGALGQERLGDKTINTVLIGQNLAFASPGEDNVGGAYFGFGINLKATELVTLFAAIEGTAMSDKTRSGIAQGGLRASF